MSITVICSNYNSSKWIDEYLQHLNRQTIKSFDVVFVDANSNDGSLSTIENFKFRSGINVKILPLNEKINIFEAWNIAIENSTTDYVINLNTDDRLYDNSLDIYDSYTKVYPDVDIFYSPCDIKSDELHQNKIGIYNWPEYSHHTLCSLCICGPFPLLKKASIEKAGMFDVEYPHSSDYEMWIRMSYMGMKFFRINDSLGSYYKNPKGNSTNPDNIKKAQKEDAIIQAKYRITHSKKLSLLVCSLENREQYLNRLISILQPQLNEYTDVEMRIFLDDGRHSIGAKRNSLLMSANGEYVCFIDDDDIVSNNYVQLIMNAIESSPDVVGIHLLHYEDGIHKGLTYHSLKYDHWWDEQNPDNSSLRNYYRNPNHLNPVRKELALRAMFPDINMGEDKSYSMRLLKYLHTEEYIDSPIYTYLFRRFKND